MKKTNRDGVGEAEVHIFTHKDFLRKEWGEVVSNKGGGINGDHAYEDKESDDEKKQIYWRRKEGFKRVRTTNSTTSSEVPQMPSICKPKPQ